MYVCMCVCVYVCMYVCVSLPLGKNCCQIDFKLGRCVADVPKICMCAFGAVWTRDVLDINKNLGIFIWSVSSSAHWLSEGEHGQHRFAISTHIVVEGGTASVGPLFTVTGATPLCRAVQPCHDREGERTSLLATSERSQLCFRLLKCKREGERAESTSGRETALESLNDRNTFSFFHSS